MTDTDHISEFFKSPSIAIVGVSSARMKFGSLAYRALKSKDVKVFPVNPGFDSFDGDKCYSALTALPEPVEAVLVTVKPEKAGAVVDDAIKVGVRRIWFQSGADFSQAADRAVNAGISIITGKCILLYAEPVKGIHAFHRFLARLFGQL